MVFQEVAPGQFQASKVVPEEGKAVAPPGKTSQMQIAGHFGLSQYQGCPYCGSTDTRLDNLFGPTPCRSIRYCESCRQPFEQFKTI